MKEPVDLGRTRVLASSAIAAMAQRGIPPTPNNFAVWYAHLGGTNPELSKAIEIIDESHTDFTPERNAELHERLIRNTRNVVELREAGERISAAVNTVLSLLQDAGADTQRYGKALGAAKDAMDRPLDATKLRGVVEAIMTETRRMVARNEEVAGQLADSAREVEELRRRIDDARRDSYVDALTGVGNRRMFDQRLRDFTQSAQEGGSELCLVMADIDYFKKFNDSYGHQLGDLVLRLVARALTEGVKGRDLVCRYGGEEFAILLPQTKLNDALSLGEQLRRMIGARHIVQKGEARDLGNVTLSMGVSRWHAGEPIVEFVQRADAALYFAKRHGRNRVCSERDLQTGSAAAAPVPVQAPASTSAGR